MAAVLHRAGRARAARRDESAFTNAARSAMTSTPVSPSGGLLAAQREVP
ncbi:MAG: hypothetical protein HZY78_06315 [Burkholderiaceae bacterium]|nr:MAG: hypothetical protein HZY78_06315 [Burkholderiaceae bacterium]